MQEIKELFPVLFFIALILERSMEVIVKVYWGEERTKKEAPLERSKKLRDQLIQERDKENQQILSLSSESEYIKQR